MPDLELGALVTWSDEEDPPTWFTGRISAVYDDGQIEVEPTVRPEDDDGTMPHLHFEMPIMLDAASVKLVAQSKEEND